MNEMEQLEGNATVSASVPLPDYIWFVAECKRRGLTKSAMIARLIADAHQSAE